MCSCVCVSRFLTAFIQKCLTNQWKKTVSLAWKFQHKRNDGGHLLATSFVSRTCLNRSKTVCPSYPLAITHGFAGKFPNSFDDLPSCEPSFLIGIFQAATFEFRVHLLHNGSLFQENGI